MVVLVFCFLQIDSRLLSEYHLLVNNIERDKKCNYYQLYTNAETISITISRNTVFVTVERTIDTRQSHPEPNCLDRIIKVFRVTLYSCNTFAEVQNHNE